MAAQDAPDAAVHAAPVRLSPLNLANVEVARHAPGNSKC